MTQKYEPNIWYGWNGGECPVHAQSEVEIMPFNGNRQTASAQAWNWTHDDPYHPGNIIAFRVVKEHREPREWWALWSPAGNLIGNFTKEEAQRKNEVHYDGKGEIIHVREVLE